MDPYQNTDLLSLRNKKIKKGVPVNAVIIPTGNSWGAIMFRAAKSDNTRKDAPPNKQQGSKRR